MPIIHSAIKKLRQDRKQEAVNRKKRDNLKTVIKKAQKSKAVADITAAISTIDKAVKRHLLHKNKASRLKSKLSKLVSKPSFANESKSARVKQPSFANESKSARVKQPSFANESKSAKIKQKKPRRKT